MHPSEDEKDFTLKLGTLAIRFSILEFYSGEILSLLISREESLIGAYILEGMSFYKKIELMKEFSGFRSEHGNDLENLATEINKIRKTRNQFIHGLWRIPTKKTTGYTVVVEERKIKKKLIHEGRGIQRTLNQWNTYSKESIERLIVTVDLLIASSLKLITKLEEDQSLGLY